MKPELVVVLPTTHLTLRAEEAFEARGLPSRTIMKPRRISSDCGLAISLLPSDHRAAREVLVAEGLLPASFYLPQGTSWSLLEEVSSSQPSQGGAE